MTMTPLDIPTDMTVRKSDFGYGPVPNRIYHDPAAWEKEKEAIFRRSWHFVGRVERVAKKGSFFVCDLPTFNVSVIIVRDREGVLRAYYNICRHRGTTVEERCEGSTAAFTCRFHGWSYDLHGNLTKVRDPAGFPELDFADYSLVPLHVDEWRGFIFVNVEEDTPSETLLEHMGEQGEDLASYPFEDRSAIRWQFQTEMNCNWKLVVDSFSEAYHLPSLHVASIGGNTMGGDGNPNGRLLNVGLKGRNRSMSFWGNYSAELTPVQELAYTNAPGPSVTGGQTDKEFVLPKGLNESRHGEWTTDIQIFFPNFLFGMSSGMYFIHQIWPISVNRTVYQLHGFMRKATNAAQRFGQENAMVELRQVVMMEDINTLERIQRSMESGQFDQFTFHDHELGLRHHYHTVASILEDYDKEQLAKATPTPVDIRGNGHDN